MRNPVLPAEERIVPLSTKLALVALATLLVVFTPGVTAGDNGDCLVCHADPSMTTERKGKTISISVDEKVRGASVHAGLECVNCHADASMVPHETTPGRVDCANCHADVAEKHKDSVHGITLLSSKPRALCSDCHGTHDIRKASDRDSKVFAGRLPETCGKCHAEMSQSYLGSTHAQGLLASGLLVSASCNDCHGTHEIQPNVSPASMLNARNVPGTCGTCHVGVVATYEGSVHGQLWKQGAASAPTCVSCHSSHTIKRHETEQFRLGVVSQCGSCHAKDFETYRQSYHGQVTALGFALVAQCSDCHGSHSIQPSVIETSMTSAKNRMATCKSCHPSANDSFASFDPHADPTDKERSPLLYYINSFMVMLLFGVFALFGSHTVLWSVRSAINKRRARRTVPEPREEGEDDHAN